MGIEFWSRGQALDDLKKFDIVIQKQALARLERFNRLPVFNLIKSQTIKRIKGEGLQEIKIGQIRFLGLLYNSVFWIFTAEKKQKNKLSQKAFKRAKNIKNKFMEFINENK